MNVPDPDRGLAHLSWRARGLGALLALAAVTLVSVLVWLARASGGAPDPLTAAPGSNAAVVDIGILVFREGLECVLVLAALTANLVGDARVFRRPISLGVGLAVVATLVTWFIAITIVDNLTESFSALQVQAATGLVAIVVLLVVMNWFFHRVYWTGWIAAHTKRKRTLLKDVGPKSVSTVEPASHIQRSARRVFWGLAALGFTSFYREGFEVVLFLQTYRLRLGGTPVLRGVSVGVLLSGIVAALTLVAHRRLPHRKMLVLTGVLLAGVLVVMVGEQAQEMQLAGWLSTTPIRVLESVLAPWMGLWFALFPTVESLAAQGLAVALVLGSYIVVRLRMRRLRLATA